MKAGEVHQATAHYLELKKTDERIRLEQQRLKDLEDHKKELERQRPIDPNKGSNIDIKV